MHHLADSLLNYATVGSMTMLVDRAFQCTTVLGEKAVFVVIFVFKLGGG